MYSNLAKYYDIIHSDTNWKDYKLDSQKVHKTIQEYKKIKGKELLDVACGTGNHIQYLKRQTLIFYQWDLVSCCSILKYCLVVVSYCCGGNW